MRLPHQENVITYLLPLQQAFSSAPSPGGRFRQCTSPCGRTGTRLEAPPDPKRLDPGNDEAASHDRIPVSRRVHTSGNAIDHGRR